MQRVMGFPVTRKAWGQVWHLRLNDGRSPSRDAKKVPKEPNGGAGEPQTMFALAWRSST